MCAWTGWSGVIGCVVGLAGLVLLGVCVDWLVCRRVCAWTGWSGVIGCVLGLAGLVL